ncbi:LytR/AlgR family response regulator transcription factor [Aurantibacillus circumpalustris]|uniref:LytR/AlgR family response regulator transcription factor n=1 Tax=Aurantibacillus circumpalustris TaxID=3036359 RepID=UPI00295AE863|nr:LytTR family DNA-binding domain-containing protein [Aurantibacillus circumpalustris]
MKKLKCIIVDDEPLALDLVGGYILKTPFLELKAKCLNAFEAIQILNSEKIDLVFLDIQMPDMNGIDLSKTISLETKIVFTTAFKDYAIDGFKVNAVDFLLKPFNYVEFLNAANKALVHLAGKVLKSDSIAENQFMFVKSEYKQLKINFYEVYYFEGLKDYIKIWLTSQPKPILTLMSLKTLEEELPEDRFMRIHRSFIIALDKIQAVERGQVIIHDQRITVAEQYKNKFQQFIEHKSFN